MKVMTNLTGCTIYNKNVPKQLLSVRIYDIYMKHRIIPFMAVVPILLLAAAGTTTAFAWSGDWGQGSRYGENIGIGQPLGPGSYDNGFYAGQQDAIYDHTNNLVYNPVGQCLECHSQVYWSGFHHGYDQQWNTYQSQETTQGTSINIYGNNNYVSTNQNSGQSQGAGLPQLIGHGLCSLGFQGSCGYGEGAGPISDPNPGLLGFCNGGEDP
jgi:hypothetical protein